MPSPTPPDKVLAAARKFALEKFALQHRYAMVLHTDQKHPHVHMVVKAESEDGRRLHIDKDMLRHWREDFAQAMRQRGVVANATPRFARGRNKRKASDAIFKAGQRGASTALRERAQEIARQLLKNGSLQEPARPKLIETRKALTDAWLNVANALDSQGETSLASEVRNFTRHLPRVLTDRERVAVALDPPQMTSQPTVTKTPEFTR
jgi:hypothetical protein